MNLWPIYAAVIFVAGLALCFISVIIYLISECCYKRRRKAETSSRTTDETAIPDTAINSKRSSVASVIIHQGPIKRLSRVSQLLYFYAPEPVDWKKSGSVEEGGKEKCSNSLSVVPVEETVRIVDELEKGEKGNEGSSYPE